MKGFIILILLFSCSRSQTEKSDQAINKLNTDFYSLLEQLPKLKTPLTFRSDRQIKRDSLVDEKLVSKIQANYPSFNPYGKVYQTDEFIAVIGLGAADILTPVLAIYNKKGELIDSFSLYPTAGEDIGYHSINIVTLTANQEFYLSDSTVTRKIDKDGTKEIAGTDSVTLHKKRFQITVKGEIEEIR